MEWSSLNKIETLFRKAIKITFGMSEKTPNEIIFIESGFTNLKAEIYKRQYKFWKKLVADTEGDSSSPVSLVIKMGIHKNIH